MWRVATFIALVFALAASARAEISSTEYVHFYPVDGLTLADAAARIHADSPIIIDDRKFVGLSQPRFKWSLETESASGPCSIKSAQVSLITHTTLPRWRHLRGARLVDANEWNRFIAALTQHERNHKVLYEAGAHRLRDAFLNLPPQRNCRVLRRTANRIFQDEISRIQTENSRYDKDVRHGLDEGTAIRLPKS